MKTRLLLSIAILAAALCAQAAIVTNQINVPTDLQTIVTGTSNSTSGVAFDIPQGVDIILYPSVAAANAGTSNAVFSFSATGDKSKYTTTYPYTATIACNGTTEAVGMTRLFATNLIGVKAIRLDQVSCTQTNSVTINPLRVSYNY